MSTSSQPRTQPHFVLFQVSVEAIVSRGLAHLLAGSGVGNAQGKH